MIQLTYFKLWLYLDFQITIVTVKQNLKHKEKISLKNIITRQKNKSRLKIDFFHVFL